uniref:Uncharacterized protein n=1 Tax=Arundo donax TaxID=35708 RepID=A0A0A9G5D2_ARUDO
MPLTPRGHPGDHESMDLGEGVAGSVRISQIWPDLGNARAANRAWSGWALPGIPLRARWFRPVRGEEERVGG